MSTEQREMVARTPKHWVRLTRACNNHCIFCLDSEAQDGRFLPIVDVARDLKGGRKNKIKRVILSGGEPTIHPYFFDIVKEAREIGYTHIQIITNGRMFAYKNFLKQSIQNGVSEITFSMPGHTRKLYEEQTRMPGSFKQSLAGLLNALAIPGLIVNIDIVINKYNIKYLPDILNFYVSLGVSEFDLLQVVPFGEAWHNRDNVLYDVAKERGTLHKALTLSHNPGLYIWTNRFPPEYLENFEFLIQNPVKLYDEIDGRRDVFEKFLKNGQGMHCLGERCNYCFLKNFCRDLIAVTQKGRIESFRYPVCLRERGKAAFSKNYTFNRSSIDIHKFLDFFIKHRYFIKSLRCKDCNFNNSCNGMQCDYIRRYGFKSLAPILKKDKYTKQKTLRKNIPYKILRLTLACNAHCSFCNVPLESYPLQEMSKVKAKQEIGRLISLDKALRLDITGGEPTLRKDLAKIIKYAADKGVHRIQLQTNGILLANNSYVIDLKKAGLTDAFVALHSSSATIHDSLMGTEGAFEMCARGIYNLISNDIKVTLNPVVTSRNYRGLPEYINFVKRTFPKIKSISLSVIQPRGRAAKNISLIPRYRIIDPYVRKALSLAEDNGLMVHNPYCGLPLCVGGWDKYLERCVEYSVNSLNLESAIDTVYSNDSKVKGACCLACSLAKYCNGVWKEYAAIYSFSDLKPFVK